MVGDGLWATWLEGKDDEKYLVVRRHRAGVSGHLRVGL